MKEILTHREFTKDKETHVIVQGKLGIVEFHFYKLDENESKELFMRQYSNTPGYMSLGVEGHESVPLEEANHAHCWLLDGPCKHDGTSLYAEEVVMPAYVRFGVDYVYSLLEKCYYDWFDKCENQ